MAPPYRKPFPMCHKKENVQKSMICGTQTPRQTISDVDVCMVNP
jgi:hypothetical protein